jgi:hypothetical protein
MRTRHVIVLTLAFAAWAAALHAQPALQTPAEQAAFGAYTQHAEVAAFLEAVAKASPAARVQVVGKVDPAKEFPGANLYLCILTDEGVDNPKALDRRKPTFLLLAAQHGNEQSAKEAALALIRDLAGGSLRPLLKQVNVLVMPQTNPYGNFVNRRQNEQDLDLNRDHVKLESPETRAIHAVFNAWTPEVTLDVHEKGDDYYRVSTGCVSNVNIDPAIERFSRDTIFKEVEAFVTAGGSTWHEYLVTEAMGSQGAAGAPEPREQGRPRETLTRPSTTDLNDGRNSLGIYETVSFIQEGASRHDVPTLKDRTAWQYLGIRGLLESAARHREQVLTLVNGRRAALLKKAQAPAAGDLIHLRMGYVRDPKDPELTIRSFERQPAGAAPAADAAPKVVTTVVKNWFPKVEPSLSVPRAVGYIVPAARADVVKTLVDHGIQVRAFAADAEVEVEAYEVGEIVPAPEDYVAPEKIAVAKKMLKLAVKKGDVYVPGAQRAANLVPNLLEPQAEYGLIRYRSYKLVPEKGSQFPIVRVAAGAKLPAR